MTTVETCIDNGDSSQTICETNHITDKSEDSTTDVVAIGTAKNSAHLDLVSDVGLVSPPQTTNIDEQNANHVSPPFTSVITTTTSPSLSVIAPKHDPEYETGTVAYVTDVSSTGIDTHQN